MAGGVPLNWPAARGNPGWAWAGGAALLAALALVGGGLDPLAIDWQPALLAHQPWRALSAVAVHYSGLHLAANLAGALLVGALGPAARLPRHCLAAWALAWPLTQLGLLLQPALLHYGGLSGVLHAGVAVVAIHLLIGGTPAQRRIGGAMLAVLALKILGESPWGPPLRHPAGWDIAVAPAAHASGALAGALCAALTDTWMRRRASPARHHA